MTKDNCDKSITTEMTSVDYVTTAAKAILGAVPFAGSLLTELAGTIIPNQRIDRLAKFAVNLEEKLSQLDQKFVQAQLKDENFTDLLEDGLRQAARSVSDERRQYLAALLTNGITSEAVTYSESKHILRILGEINDIEVIWLRFFLDPTMNGDRAFREKHNDIIKSIVASMSSSQDELDKYAIQQSYKEHLANLGLLSRRYDVDMKSKQPIFDNNTGTQKVRGYQITPLGRLLLRQIAFLQDSHT